MQDFGLHLEQNQRVVVAAVPGRRLLETSPNNIRCLPKVHCTRVGAVIPYRSQLFGRRWRRVSITLRRTVAFICSRGPTPETRIDRRAANGNDDNRKRFWPPRD